MKTKGMMITAVMAVILSLTGCSPETLPMDTDTDTLVTYGVQYNIGEVNTETENAEAMNIGRLEQMLPVNGEDWSLIVSYDIGDYDVKRWKITEDKTIKIEARTSGLPEGTEVFIDHVHYDISTRATKEGMNGIKQDEMDDTYHGTTQDGFYISDNVSYNNIFAIEGYSETLIKGYGYYNAFFGESSVQEEYVSESDLIHNGVYGECLQAVFDLNIKKPGETYFRTVSVLGKILIRIPEHADNDIVYLLDKNESEVAKIKYSCIEVNDAQTEVSLTLQDGSVITVPLLKNIWVSESNLYGNTLYMQVEVTEELAKATGK